MSLDTKTVTLGEERDRLDEALDDLADILADADDSTSGQRLRQRGNDLDQQGRGIAHLVDEHGADAEVVVRGLDSGEFARVEDRVADIRAQREGGQTPGAHRNVYAAMGIVDAPFADDPESFDDRLDAVTDLPIGATKWLYALVDDLTTVEEGNWTSLRERLQERRSNSTDDSTSSTRSES